MSRTRVVCLSVAVSLCLMLSAPGVFSGLNSVRQSYDLQSGSEPEPALSTLPPGRAPASPDNNPLTVDAPVLTPGVLDASQRLNLSVVVTGGYKPYNITWVGLPYGCSSHNQTSFHCNPGTPSGTPTTSEVWVRVVDTVGYNVTSNSTAVTVNPEPSVAIEISPSSGGVPPFYVNFTAISTGGTPPFQYDWTFGDGANATGPKVEHEYTSVGTYMVTVWGNDSLGSAAKGFAKVHSVGIPSIILTAVPNQSVSPGAGVTLVVATYGGLGPYTYDWTGLPDFCTPPTLPNSTSVSCSDARTGSYTISVVVTDSLLHSSVATVTLTVAAPTSAWEYVAIVFLGLAVVLGAVVTVELARTRRKRQDSPPIQATDTNPPP